MLSLPIRVSASEGGNCVTYAREVTGIELSGNAGDWWSNAEGRYPRGHMPATGAVLVFRPYGRMWAGHVAVVSRIINSREILVDHANWMRGQIVEGMAIFDVSPQNDWTTVRVADVPSTSWGRLNPTFGFIYPNGAGPRGNDDIRMAAYRDPAPARMAAEDDEDAPDAAVAPVHRRAPHLAARRDHEPREAKATHERRHPTGEAKAGRHAHPEKLEAKAEKERRRETAPRHLASTDRKSHEAAVGHPARHHAHLAVHDQPQGNSRQQIAEAGDRAE